MRGVAELSQNVLEEINKKMEEMVEGRRYIIRQVGSLKVSVDELIEKLKSGGLTPAAGAGVDVEGLTSVITALTEEVGKLQASNLEQNIKAGFEELKQLLSEVKGDVSETGESRVTFNEVVNRLENLQANIEQLTQTVQEGLDSVNEKLSTIKPGGETGTELNNVLEKLNKIEEGLTSILEKQSVIGESETGDLKNAVKKIVSTVIDLRAVIESSEESFIYGLKLIENNIRKDLENIGVKRVTCVEDALEKLRETLEGGAVNERVYDALLDLLYNLKNTNKFDERINYILGFIRELRSKPLDERLDAQLKEEINKTLLS